MNNENNQNLGVNNELNGTVLSNDAPVTLNPATPESNQQVNVTPAAQPIEAVNQEFFSGVQNDVNNAVNLNNEAVALNNNVEPAVTPSIEPNVSIESQPTEVVLQQPVEMVNTPQTEPSIESTSVEPTVMSTEPVATPIPGTEGLEGSTVVSGVAPSNSTIMNQNTTDSIGIVPPQNNNVEDKKSKKNNTIVFVILIVALIGLIGYGVYFFLNRSAKEVKLTPKTLELSVGGTLSDNIKDYANVIKGDVSNCKVNKTNINISEVGEYTFTITCDKKTFDGGKVIVKDANAPQLVLNYVFKNSTSDIDVKNFVTSCNDASECTTSIVNKDEVEANSKIVGGPYKVTIKAVDASGNETTGDTNMYVLDTDIRAYRRCASEVTPVVDYSAKKTVESILTIGIVGTDINYLGYSARVYRYVFETEEEYLKVVGNKNANISFDNNEGVATYIDDEKTILITTDLSKDTLNYEAGGSFPISFNDFTKFFEDNKNKCSNMEYKPELIINK